MYHVHKYLESLYFSGHVRDGEFSINTNYRRKRVDYTVYDNIGHGHEIHFDSFEDEFHESSMVAQGNLLDAVGDTTSLVSRPSARLVSRRPSNFDRVSNFPTMPGKAAFPTLPRNSSFQGVKDKKKPALRKFSVAAKTVMAFPMNDTTVGTSFPTVPDSPSFIPPETKFPTVTIRQVIHFYNEIEMNMPSKY